MSVESLVFVCAACLLLEALVLDVSNMPRGASGTDGAWHFYFMSWRDVQVHVTCQGLILK